VSITVNVRE